MAEMEVTAPREGLIKVVLKGRIDTEGVGQVETNFQASVCPPGKQTLLDFRAVTFLSSLGIRMLVSAAKALSRKGARMVIVSPQGLVRESIQSAALDQLIPMVDTEDEGVRILTGG